MEVKSISNAASSGRESASEVPKTIQREVLQGSTEQAADLDQSLAARHFLVRGKQSGPLVKPASNFLETVIGKDDRARILETSKLPWRMVCALDIESPYGSFNGTGWFVGPKTLITAGHCVCEKDIMGGWAQKITVSPGRNGTERPYGSAVATKFTSLDRWVQDQDPDFDVGCIHLDQPLGATTGFFSIGALPDDDLKNALVNISGYPADKADGSEQWFHANHVTRVGPRRVFYEVDTFGGQSGAPVWIYEDGSDKPLAVAIHAYGTSGTPASFKITANSAPRILPEVLQQIRAWIDADGA
jgi:glutamyl endopeptidase